MPPSGHNLFKPVNNDLSKTIIFLIKGSVSLIFWDKPVWDVESEWVTEEACLCYVMEVGATESSFHHCCGTDSRVLAPVTEQVT